MSSNIPGALQWSVEINISFPYKSIQEHGCFRILKLLPGDANAPIECELLYVNLNDVPPFEAFSYAWGDEMDGAGISLDGQGFCVRLNLFFALAFLRHRSLPRLLWVDAICINQTDVEERGSQVAIMRNIYGNATRTVVWLGLGDERTDLAIDFLPRLVEVFQTPRDREVEVLDPLLAGADFVSGLIAVVLLLKRPWFSWVWVIQEVAVAKNAMVFLGRNTNLDGMQSMHMEYFKNLCGPCFQGILSRAIQRKHKFNETTQKIIEYLNRTILMDLMVLPVAKGSLSLLAERIPIMSLLFYTRQHKSTDPRDRVFAWYGIAKDLDHIKPDYSKSVGEIYAAVTKGSIISTGKLDELRWIGSTEKCSRDEIPSWVPDYHRLHSHPLDSLFSPTYHPCGTATAPEINTSLINDPDCRILRLTGIRVDVITTLTSSAPTYSNIAAGIAPNPYDILSEWKSTASATRNETYRNDETRWHAFWRTLIADRAVTHLHKGGAPDNAQKVNLLRDSNIPASARRLDKEDICAPPATIEEEEKLIGAFERYAPPFLGRKLCVTSRGLMGLVSPFARPGDFVCVLKGGSAAYVLRRLEDGFWMFVGECYLHGVMDGEMIEEEKAGCCGFEEFKLI